MDEQLVDALRRRAERGPRADVDRAFDDARTRAATRRRRRRAVAAAVVVCVVGFVGAVFVVAMSRSDDHAEVATEPPGVEIPIGWRRYDARSADVSIGIPPGWTTNRRRLSAPGLRPIVGLGSTTGASTICDEARPGSGTAVAVYEVIGHVAGRPYTFPEPDASLDESRVVERPSDFAAVEPVTGFTCGNAQLSPGPAVQTRVYLFRDHGRTFFAVAATNDPPFSDFDAALRVLDTLHVGRGSSAPATTPATTPATAPPTRADGRDSALQFRPVLAQAPPEDPAIVVDDARTRSAVASCDVAQIGPEVPSTSDRDVDPASCVLLAQDGIRYLLGPSQVDGVSVAEAKKEVRSGMGWLVDMTFTPNGARAVDDLARQQFHQQIAVVANGVLVAAPTIQPNQVEFQSFGGHLVVSGGDEASADAVLRALGR
jgi:hypothetical protein